MPSALWPVRSTLVDWFTTAFGGTDTVVFDGPRSRGNPPRQFLIVGASGEIADVPYARTVQQASPMGNLWREEAGEIDCTVVAWHGDTDIAPLRTLVEDIVDTCETAINTDRTLGDLLTMGNFAEMTGLEVREAQTDKGPFVEAVFTIAYATVLTS